MSTLSYSVAELAGKVGVPVIGNGDAVATGVSSLVNVKPGTVIFAERDKDVEKALNSEAAAVVASVAPGDVSTPAILQSTKVRMTFAQISQLFWDGYPREGGGIHPAANIDPGATLGDGAAVGAGSYIGPGVTIGAGTIIRSHVVVDEGSQVGADCYLFPGCVIGRGTILGDRCTIHPNAVIGGEGFGFTEGIDVTTKQPQFGRVVLGDDCEIGANTCIDRGTLDDTVLGNDVKLDNLVQIGHNCRLGNHIRIAAQTGLSGGVIVEDYCILAGQVGVQNKVRIGRASMVGGQSGVLRNVEPGSQIWGLPARNHRDTLKEFVLISRLPELVGRVDVLEERIESHHPSEEETG